MAELGKSIFWGAVFGAVAELGIIICSVMIGSEMVKGGIVWPFWLLLIVLLVSVLLRFVSEAFKTGEKI